MPGTRGAVPVPLQDGARDVTQLILDSLDSKPSFETGHEFPSVPQMEIKAALDRLASRQMVQYKTRDIEQAVLTSEGQIICDEGSHEYKVWETVRRHKKLELKDLAVSAIPRGSARSLRIRL